jgi:hypothetical protein
VCLNADGSPTRTPLTESQQCGALQVNPNFNPLLACYDLTRTSPLPASDGCPGSTSGEYILRPRRHPGVGAFSRTPSIKNWTFNLGVRFDYYDGITSAAQGEPRLGIAYNFKPTNTVCCASPTPAPWKRRSTRTWCWRARMQQPGDQRLPVEPGRPLRDHTPLSPGWRNEFHAGLQQAFGKYFVLDGEYIWKYTHKAFDFSVLGNTPITFRSSGRARRFPAMQSAAPCRTSTGSRRLWCSPAWRRASLNRRSAELAPRPAGSEVFRIDHDEKFSIHHAFAVPALEEGPWLGFNWRYDSGLVAGPVPCAGGNCANGRTEPIPSWTFPASRRISSSKRALLRERACDADHADQSERPLPGIAVRFDAAIRFPRRHGERRPQPAAHRIPQSLRCCRGPRQPLSRRQVQVERARDGGEPDEQRGAVQLPFHVQRNALRFAAGGDRDDRVPLLGFHF